MKYSTVAVFLIFLATIKVVADLADLKKISAVAAVTNVSPAMKVFTAHKGYETYSSKFELIVNYHDGETNTMQLDTHNYSGLKGPYNRRNVYGALIAYGPILFKNLKTKPMWEEMAQRSFCGASTILLELGFENLSGVKDASIRYLGQVKLSSDFTNYLSISCV